MQKKILLNSKLEIWLASDIKFLIMMLGREGYDKSWCLLYLIFHLEISKYHRIPHSDEDYLSLNKQIIKKLKEKAKEIKLCNLQNKKCISVGIKHNPIFDFIPTSRIVIPLIYIARNW